MKKGISESKVRRMRNLVTGKHGDRTRIQSGYTKTSLKRHKEGDVWEEGGKTWTIKNGIKQNVTKLDQVRSKVLVPVACPECGGEMNHKLSKYYWEKLGMCKNCAIKFHTQLKVDGKWEEYTEKLSTANFDYWLDEVKKEYAEWLDTSESKYITETGTVESWSSGTSKEEMTKEFAQKLEELEQQRKDVNSEGTTRESDSEH